MTHSQHLNLTLDLVGSSVVIQSATSDKFDGNLYSIVAVHTELDLAKLAFSEGLEKNVLSQGDHVSMRMCLLVRMNRWVEHILV